MKIIWADDNAPLQNPDREELKAEVAIAGELSRKGIEDAQEKSSRKELKGFG